VALVVLLGIHTGVLHLGNLGKIGQPGRGGHTILFRDIAYRLQMVLWRVVDGSLLGFTVFHGFNGIRLASAML